MTTSPDYFTTDVAGLPETRSTEVFELADGDEFDLRIAPVAKQLGEATARMLAYNGSIPGPTLRVPEGSEVVVNVVNEGDLEATVHWHGLRLDNRYDVAPSERVVVDVLFDTPGELTLEHRTPERTYALATVSVTEERAEPSRALEFDSLRGAPELEAERKQLSSYLAAEPDKTLALIAEMDLGGPEVEQGAVFACPMHPAIVASWAGKCPKCGMKLVAAEPGVEPPTAYVCPMHPEVTATWAATCPKCGMTLRPSDAGGDGEHGHETSHEEAGGHGHGAGHSHGTAEGIEWEDDMVDVNRVTTPANMRWG